MTTRISPPSPGQIPISSSPGQIPISSSPVSSISRTGLVTPSSPVRIISSGSVTPPATTSPIRVTVPSPRTTSLPSLIQLRPTTVTPAVSSRISPTMVTSRVSPTIRPITPQSRVVTPRVSPTVISPRVSQVSPGPLGQIPGFASGVVTPPSISRSVITPSSARTGSILKESTGRRADAEMTIEDKLAEQGYTVTDKVFVRTNSGMSPKYLKTKNSFGQTAFVELDEEGGVVYQGDNQTMIVNQDATMVPEAKLIGSYECATAGGACGVAYECDNGICSLVQSIDSPSQPIRLSLTSASKPTEKSLSLSGSPIAYPVVRYSDVVSNPIETAASIERSNRNIRNSGYQECLGNWQDFSASLENMDKAAREYMRTFKGYLDRSAEDLRTLNGYRAAYVKKYMVDCPDRKVMPEEERRKFQLVAQNIDDRNEKLIALYAICQVIPDSTRFMNERAESLRQSTKNMNNLFSDLGKVVTRSNEYSV